MLLRDAPFSAFKASTEVKRVGIHISQIVNRSLCNKEGCLVVAGGRSNTKPNDLTEFGEGMKAMVRTCFEVNTVHLGCEGNSLAPAKN